MSGGGESWALEQNSLLKTLPSGMVECGAADTGARRKALFDDNTSFQLALKLLALNAHGSFSDSGAGGPRVCVGSE